MALSHLLVLSLLLSVGVAALSLITGRVLEMLSGDPVLRDRLWGALLILPLAPPLVVGLILALTPAPVVTLPAPVDAPSVATESATSQTLASAPAAAPLFDLEAAVWSLAAVAAILTILAMARLALRGARLVRLLRAAVPSDPELQATVDQAAHAVGAPRPRVRVSSAAQEPLLVGLARPHLILPAGFRGADPAGRAVVAHELAHLKRGDHRAVWLEEGVLILLAFNPLAPLIRARRAAAREEACDALALAGAAPETRRAYAQSLIEALRSPSSPNASLPALTFTGTPRSQAMRRLKSILTPPAAAGRRAGVVAALAAAALVSGASLAGAALAAHRAPALQAADQGDLDPNWPERYLQANARDGQLYCAAPEGDRDRIFGCDSIIWAAAEQEERAPTGAFCAPATNVVANLENIAAEGRTRVIATDDVSGSAMDGARRALTTAFPCGGARAQPVAVNTARNEALHAEWSARHAARSAAESAAVAGRIRTETAADVKVACRPGGEGESGCNGMILGAVIGENEKPADQRRFCAVLDRDQAIALTNRMKTAIARTPAASADENGRVFVTRVMTEAYPCAAQADSTRVSLNLRYPDGYVAQTGDRLEIDVNRDFAGQAHKRTLSIALDRGSQPDEASAMVDQRFYSDGRSPRLTARLINAEGAVIAREDIRPRPSLVRTDQSQALETLVLINRAI